MSITKDQIKIIHTLLQKAGQMDNKKEIIKNASATGKESTKDLTFDEAAALITFLQTPNPKPQTPNSKPQIQDGQQMINYIIAASWEMGWVKKIKKVDKVKGVIEVNDYSHMHEKIKELCYKKPINEYSVAELTKLVTVIKKINLSYIQKNKSNASEI